MIVCAVIAHHADCMHIGQHGKELPQLIRNAALFDLISEHGIGILQDLNFLRGDLADDAHAESRTRERLPPDQCVRNPKQLADLSDLIFEQLCKRFDRAGKMDILRHFHHVVMCFDDRCRALTCLIASAAFNAVGIDRALREEAVSAELAQLAPEYIIELCADDFALLFRIGHAL